MLEVFRGLPVSYLSKGFKECWKSFGGSQFPTLVKDSWHAGSFGGGSRFQGFKACWKFLGGSRFPTLVKDSRHAGSV